MALVPQSDKQWVLRLAGAGHGAQQELLPVLTHFRERGAPTACAELTKYSLPNTIPTVEAGYNDSFWVYDLVTPANNVLVQLTPGAYTAAEFAVMLDAALTAQVGWINSWDVEVTTDGRLRIQPNDPAQDPTFVFTDSVNLETQQRAVRLLGGEGAPSLTLPRNTFTTLPYVMQLTERYLYLQVNCFEGSMRNVVYHSKSGDTLYDQSGTDGLIIIPIETDIGDITNSESGWQPGGRLRLSNNVRHITASLLRSDAQTPTDLNGAEALFFFDIVPHVR